MTFQSPTTLYTADISPVPAAAIASTGKLLKQTFGGDIKALHKALLENAAGHHEQGAPRESLAALAQSASFAFLTLPSSEARPLSQRVAERIAKQPDLIKTLTDHRVVGRLNQELVEFFVENRKLEAPNFWERAIDKLGEFNPITRWHQLRQMTQPESHTPDELKTLGEDKDPQLLQLTHRYLRRMLHHPEKLHDPKKGDARADIITQLLPRLIEILNDPDFLATLNAKTRARFEDARDQLGATIATSINANTWPFLTDPHAYDLQIGDIRQGALHVEPKSFKADNYGEASGQEIRIEASTETGGKANVSARGTDYFVDHAHWHLGATEHVIAGDKRNLKGELHIVHKNEKGDQALVLGAFIEVVENAPNNPFVQSILDQSAGHKAATESSATHLDFLPREAWEQGKYHTYHGTLTTAPYSEGVDFYLLKDKTIQLNPAQYDAWKAHMELTEGHEHNARTAQPYNDRTIIEVGAQSTTHEISPKPQRVL